MLFASIALAWAAAPPPPVPVQDPPSEETAPARDLDAEWSAFEEALGEASEAWWAAYQAWQAKTEAGEDAGAEPAYPAAEFMPRAEAIAEAGHVGARYWLMQNTMREPAVSYGWLRRALLEAPDDDAHARELPYLHYAFPGNDEVVAILEEFARATSREDLAAVGRLGQALVLAQGDAAQRARGLALLEELSELEVDFVGKDRIAGELFSARYLSVGQVPPTWEAVDVDGAPIGLADYRGKVTILEFWGFW